MAHREPACTPRCKCEPRARSVARALGLRSREFWQITTGNHSDLLEPSRTMETPSFHIFLSAAVCCCIMSDPMVPRALYRGSHGTATVVHQALPFVTATASAFCVCACVGRDSCQPRSYRANTYIILTKVQFIGCCAGAGRRFVRTHTSSVPGMYFKSNAQPRCALQQQQYNSSVRIVCVCSVHQVKQSSDRGLVFFFFGAIGLETHP